MTQHLPPTEQDQLDFKWADLARNARQALALLGYPCPPCLPGEPEACGGRYCDHLAAYFGALRAVITHHLLHLQPPPRMVHDVMKETAAKIREDCHHGTGARDATS